MASLLLIGNEVADFVYPFRNTLIGLGRLNPSLTTRWKATEMMVYRYMV